jgi:uncharacterized lipoprotein YddW (UPF0748 family)
VKRRRFLETLAAATAGLGLRPTARPALPSAPGRAPDFARWVWVHGGVERDLSEWRARFARIRAAGLAGVLVSGGESAGLAEAAHAEGLAFQRWIWTLNRSGDHWVKEHHPEWFTVSRDGDSSLEKPPYVDYYQWLCPTRREVRVYLSRIVEEIARDPAVDGVHLDYVRHSDVILPRGLWSKYDLVQDRELPEFDFCYCQVCRAAFRDQAGTDPLDLPDPAEDRAWREFRCEGVTRLVRELTEVAHAHGKPISAAVFPTPKLARRLVRQAWDAWPIDACFPMLYHRFYEQDLDWIGEATREGVAALPARTPLYAGLFLPSLAPDELAQASRIAQQGGAAGISLFDLDALSDAHLTTLAPQPEE